jgi:hypothetical protein
MSKPTKSCETKKRFADRISADAFISRFIVSNGRPGNMKRRPYKCTQCAYWHVTSKPPGRGEGQVRGLTIQPDALS